MYNYFVYILKCSDNSYYTGVTNDIEKRLLEHNSGMNSNSYTHDKRPCELMFYELFTDVNQAISFEKKVKGWTRKKKEALIDTNWEKLKDLASCLNKTSHLNFGSEKPFTSALLSVNFSAQGDKPNQIIFPAYRKYKNNKHFFKIINENEFEEISFIGSKIIVTNHIAKILPDRNLIADLLNDSNFAELSTQEEYESYLKD